MTTTLGLRQALAIAVCALAFAGANAESPALSREIPQELRKDLDRAHEKQFVPVPPSLRGEVQRAELLGRRLHQALAADAPLPPAAWAQAAQRAATFLLPICSGMRYRPTVVDAQGTSDAGEPAWVYMIAEPIDDNLLVAGVHLRLGLAAKGEGFDSLEPSSHVCVTAQRRPDDAQSVYFFTQVRSCVPNEHHVRISLDSPHPVMVLSSVGLWRLDRGAIQLATPLSRPCLNDRLSLLLNRWVLFRRSDKDGSYQVGMPYIDWSAGITLHTAGSVVVDSEGRIALVEGSNPTGYFIKFRLLDKQGRASYGYGVALSADQVRRLGLDEQPAWLAAYRGPADPVVLDLQRGSYFNHIGDSEAALHYLEPLRGKPVAKPAMLALELGYAYNALHRFDKAIAVLNAAVETMPFNYDLARELAYGYRHAAQPTQAAVWYERSFELTPADESVFRTQVAAVLAELHRDLGQAEACQRWKARAQDAATGLAAANAQWRQQLEAMNCSN
ncbi:MAG: tetratricopeptide repeat protein [Burkholderiales bacterium]|nr:tetratricopeptide repeat protein [Burkholderiales bacterium]